MFPSRTILPAFGGPDLFGVGGGLFAGVFGLIFVGFGILFVAVVTFIIVVAVRKARVARQAGYDPLTMDVQLAARVMDSELLRPASPTPPAAPAPTDAAPTTEQRLRELDDLAARGVITAAERDSARASVLGGGSPS